MLQCPGCHAIPVGPVETTDGGPLRPGVWTVCGACALILRVADDGTLRAITPEDLATLDAEGLAYLVERKIEVHRRRVEQMARDN